MFARYIKLIMKTSTAVEFWNVTQLYTIGQELIITNDESNDRHYTVHRFHLIELLRMEVEF